MHLYITMNISNHPIFKQIKCTSEFNLPIEVKQLSYTKIKCGIEHGVQKNNIPKSISFTRSIRWLGSSFNWWNYSLLKIQYTYVIKGNKLTNGVLNIESTSQIYFVNTTIRQLLFKFLLHGYILVASTAVNYWRQMEHAHQLEYIFK